MPFKSIYLFGIVIAIIVFFGVFIFIKNRTPSLTNTPSNTPSNTSSNTPSNTPANTPTNTPTNRTVNNPPITPPRVTQAITRANIVPPVVKAPFASKPFKIRSVSTGLYYGDKGMTPNISDAIIFTENEANNLTTGDEEWAIKYVELNGKAMLTNESKTAGYVINTAQKSSGGPALASSPFMAIPSVAAALSSQNSKLFQVVKVY